jgi:hypothetical protein
MHPMSPRARLDLAARAEERQLHLESFTSSRAKSREPVALRSVLLRDPSTRFAPLGMTVICGFKKAKLDEIAEGPNPRYGNQ